MSTTAVATRTITIFSPQGKTNNKITCEGCTWGDLKAELKRQGYNIDNMTARENIRKTTLEHPGAILPEGDFVVHLFPKKTKSGLSRAEINSAIKGHIEADGESAKAYFNEGQNYTRKPSPELETLLSNYKGSGKKAKTAAVKATPVKADKPAKAEKPADKVIAKKVKATPVATPETTAKAAIVLPEKTDNEKLTEALELTNGITGHENQDHVNSAVKSLRAALVPKPTEDEMTRLQREHDELSAGL